jgi:preprotein translocase subunit YajC
MLTVPLFALALAQEAGSQSQQLNPLQRALGGLGMMPMMLLIFGIFYLLVIRPQQQKQKEHEAWQKRVGAGDEVVTSGGLVGKITHVADDVLTIEVGDKVRVRVLRSHVTGAAPGKKAAGKDADAAKSEKKESA